MTGFALEVRFKAGECGDQDCGIKKVMHHHFIRFVHHHPLPTSTVPCTALSHGFS